MSYDDKSAYELAVGLVGAIGNHLRSIKPSVWFWNVVGSTIGVALLCLIHPMFATFVYSLASGFVYSVIKNDFDYDNNEFIEFSQKQAWMLFTIVPLVTLAVTLLFMLGTKILTKPITWVSTVIPRFNNWLDRKHDEQETEG